MHISYFFKLQHSSLTGKHTDQIAVDRTYWVNATDLLVILNKLTVLSRSPEVSTVGRIKEAVSCHVNAVLFNCKISTTTLSSNNLNSCLSDHNTHSETKKQGLADILTPNYTA